MGIVYKHVATKSSSSKIVNTAGTIRDVAHDEGFSANAETGQDIRDGGGEEEETLGELQSDLLGPRCADPVDGLVDLERVVGGQQSDSGIDVCIVENLRRNLIQGSTWFPGLRN